MNVVAIIQARMSSTRLPGKILMPIQGKPMLWHIVSRLKRVKGIDKVVIATSDLHVDDAVEQMAEKNNLFCFRGSQSDLLKRYYDAASKFNANHVIRVTGDCPLVDPFIVSKLIKLYFDGNYDMCGLACGAGAANENNINRFPDGLDAEILSINALADAHKLAKSDLQREHVTPFFWQNKNQYNLGGLHCEIGDYSKLRLTVDNQEDYDFISWIYDMLYPKNNQFDLNEVLVLLSNHPHRQKTNIHLIGQEGYEKFWE